MAKKKADAPKKNIAKRDFILKRNDDHFDIKKGDDIDEMGIPKIYLQNLKTEKVI